GEPIVITYIDAPATVGDLTKAHEENGDTLAFPFARDLPCASSAPGDWHLATHLVSYKVAAIATCMRHEAEAEQLAREAYSTWHASRN
ncbi:hypothetical protein ACWGMW_28925, partial [Streptomyces albidoflavus]